MSYFGSLQGIESLIPLETLRKERPELGIPEFVHCDAGEFMMGGVKFDSEMPVHNVRISAPFWVGKYAVTQKQFLSVMGTNPAAWQDDLENPVEQVTWDEAAAFCAKLNDSCASFLPEGYHFDLPTEAQWEYACRAGTTTEFWWGDIPLTGKMNFSESKYGRPIRVGSYASNPWGIFDMNGNVWEWCKDWYGAYCERDEIDPVGPMSGQLRVVRGGSYFNRADDCRSAHRHEWVGPRYRHADYGFRVVISKERKVVGNG